MATVLSDLHLTCLPYLGRQPGGDASLRLEINVWSLVVMLLADLYAGKVKLHGSDVAGWTTRIESDCSGKEFDLEGRVKVECNADVYPSMERSTSQLERNT